jgi:hypothetical protein
MLNDELHAIHNCYICGHIVPWVGHIFGGITISHGNETDATVSVSKKRNAEHQVELAIQLQCPECGSINQFNVLHPLENTFLL